MELVLTVLQAPPGTQSQDQKFVLTTAGGTIGRAETSACHLPCPDRVVSSQHANIQYQGGQFYLVDVSKNGTEVNGKPAPKQVDAPHPLTNGDMIQCGRFQLSVALRSGDFAALPKGLGNADFLEQAPAALPSFPATPAPSFGAQDSGFISSIGPNDSLADDSLDSWLGAPEDAPGNHLNIPSSTSANSSASEMAGWGTVADKSKVDVCPIEALGINNATAQDIFGNDVESNNSNSQFSAPKPEQWEDDEWWKGEDSIHSNSSAMSAHVHINPFADSARPTPSKPAGAIPTPKSKPAIVAPAPVFAKAPSSAPFQGQSDFSNSAQNINASNIDDILGFNTPPEPQTSPVKMEPAFPTQTPAMQPPPPPSPQPMPIANAQPATLANSNAPSEEDFGRYLGINPKTQLPESQLKKLGAQIVKDTVGRLMDLIKARSNIKNELRVQHTTLQAQDNNPLKFSVNADDALSVLFSEARSTSFMSPEEAICDSFDDLADHQMAVMAGMQAAYEHMFKQFSPTKLEAVFNTKSGLLGNKRAANWEAFKHHYQRMTSDREATYNQMFGLTFAKHYEQRLAELKSQRIIHKPQSK